MDHIIALIMNIFNFTFDDIMKLSMNQYSDYMYHALNIFSGLRQGEFLFSHEYKTKDGVTRDRLKHLQAEHDARIKEREDGR